MHWRRMVATTVSFCACLAAAATAGAAGDPAALPATRPAIPYKTAHDRPLRATEQIVARTEAYVQYRVEFDGIEGDRVPAFLYVPNTERAAGAVGAAGSAGAARRARRPAVLLQYGSGGNKKTNYIVAIGQAFARRGFVVLTIDVPFRGERKPPHDPAEKRPLLRLPSVFSKDSQFGSFLQTLGDYSRAVDYLVARPEVDAGRIAYVGISWGAITGVTFAAHDERVKVVASLVGGGNFVGMFPGPVTPEVRAAVQRYDPVYHVGLIAPRPLLLLNVTRDLLVPRPLAEALHAAAGDNATKVWIDTDHIFSTVDRAAMAEKVIDFVVENLPKG